MPQKVTLKGRLTFTKVSPRAITPSKSHAVAKLHNAKLMTHAITYKICGVIESAKILASEPLIGKSDLDISPISRNAYPA